MVLLSHADDLVDESVDLRLFSVHDIPLHGSRGFRSQVGQDLQVHLHIIFLKRTPIASASAMISRIIALNVSRSSPSLWKSAAVA